MTDGSAEPTAAKSPPGTGPNRARGSRKERRASWLGSRDPDCGEVRKALRTALVLPVPFAFGLAVLDDELFALFAGFGVFAMLSFSDFGGALLRRARAYVVLAFAGAGVVVLGTIASQWTSVAVLGTFLVVLALQQLAVFGGYWAQATVPATLAFVLAVMVPSPSSQAVPQAAGWLVAGVLCAVAAVALWPRRSRRRIGMLAADVADRLARLLSSWQEDPSDQELPGMVDELARATDRLVAAWDAFAQRPRGPAVRDQALVLLVDQVRQIVVFAHALVQERSRSAVDDHAEVVSAAVAAMGDTSTLLRGGPDGLDLRGLALVRARDLELLEQDVAEAMAEGEGERAVARVETSFAVRMLVHLTLSMGANARLASGGAVDDVRAFEPPPMVPSAGSAGALRRGLRILRSHASPTSAWGRNAIRAAIAICASVALARVIDVEHGFWVALGTLSVLRSSAAGTAANALQAVVGTAAGFALVVPVFLLIDGNQPSLWVLLPITAFLAAWTPKAIHFVAGQASFTLFVVVLFNLVEPAGWQTGVTRLADIGLGAVVAVCVGLLLWPRGVRAQVATVIGAAYHATATYLAATYALTTSGDQGPAQPAPGPTTAARLVDAGEWASRAPVEAERLRAITAIEDADEAVMLAHGEARAQALPFGAMDQLVMAVSRLRHTADALGWIRSGLPPLRGCAATRALLDGRAASGAREVAALGDALCGGAPLDDPDERRIVAPSAADCFSTLAADVSPSGAPTLRAPEGAGGAGAAATDATSVVGMAFIGSWFEVDSHVIAESRAAARAMMGG